MTTLEELVVTVRPCEPWCEDGPEKHADQHPVDRDCWSEFQVVPASDHEPTKYSSDQWYMAFLNVYLRRKAEREDTLLYIHSEETDKELRLTLPEAQILHETIGRLLETAGQAEVQP